MSRPLSIAIKLFIIAAQTHQIAANPLQSLHTIYGKFDEFSTG